MTDELRGVTMSPSGTEDFAGTSTGNTYLQVPGVASPPAAEEPYLHTNSNPYEQTEEQELETRKVEENLRRWAERDRLQRSRSRKGATTPSNNAIVSRLGASLARVPTFRSHASAQVPSSYEMQTTHAARHSLSAPAHGEYGRVDTIGDESSFVRGNLPEGSESVQALNDNAPLHYIGQDSGGDLSSPSVDDIHNMQYESAPTSPDTPAATEQSNMDSTVARIRSRDFPKVTVGRASSFQQRRRRPRLNNGVSGSRSTRNSANAIGAIPEHEAPFSATSDVTEATVDDVTNPFRTPQHSHSSLNQEYVSLDKEPLPFDMQGVSLQSDYDRAPATMHISSASMDKRDKENKWFWSDLFLGCGLCMTDEDGDDQAAHTNPME